MKTKLNLLFLAPLLFSCFGEGDSYRGYYNYYLENLRRFVGNILADLRDLAGETDIPFIDAVISNASVWEFYREVNNAKKRIR